LAIQETPYSLTYGTNVMILIKVGKPSLRRQLFDMDINSWNLDTNLYLLSELRDHAQIREEACKIIATRRYNSKVKSRFHRGDPVW